MLNSFTIILSVSSKAYMATSSNFILMNHLGAEMISCQRTRQRQKWIWQAEQICCISTRVNWTLLSVAAPPEWQNSANGVRSHLNLMQVDKVFVSSSGPPPNRKRGGSSLGLSCEGGPVEASNNHIHGKYKQ